MTTTLITVTGLELVTSSAADAARAQRDDLLETINQSFEIVTNEESAQRAAALLHQIKAYTKLIEEERTSVKGPILELGRRIDGLAKELTLQLDVEAGKISKVLGAYQAEQQRLAEEARRKAYEEELRLRREAEAKERAEAERQERLRQQAWKEVQRVKEENEAKARKEAEELAAKAAKAKSEGARAKFEAEAKAAQERAEAEAKLAEEKAAADLKAAEEQAEAEAQKRREELAQTVVAGREAADAVVKRPVGTATRTEMKYEITDIVALYEAAPYLVTLTENVAALKSALKGLKGEQKLPGVRHWRESSTTARG